MPALHRTVLDDERHPALAGQVDERLEDALGLGQVLGDGLPGIAAHERADGGALQQGGGLDAGGDVAVDGPARLRVGVQVVVVVRERGEAQAVPVEEAADLVRAGLVEAGGVQMAGGEVAVADAGPHRHLERLVAGPRGPGGDVGQLRPWHARREKPEPHAISG
jgi:hypothetical protein